MKEKPRFVCFICGEASEKAPGLCSVGFHRYGVLRPNEKNTGYLGSYLDGAAHSACLQQFIPGEGQDEGDCVVCRKKIAFLHKPRSSILAVYEYRKRGCKATLAMHDKCIKKIACEQFMFIKIPFLG